MVFARLLFDLDACDCAKNALYFSASVLLVVAACVRCGWAEEDRNSWPFPGNSQGAKLALLLAGERGPACGATSLVHLQ